jgi:pimeloyl-ACP methyl ester carboxylesterase
MRLSAPSASRSSGARGRWLWSTGGPKATLWTVTRDAAVHRGLLLLLAVIGTAATAAFGLVRWRLRGIPPPEMGMFPNGMAYARLGSGPRTVLFIRGGPGNVVPMGPMFLAMSVPILRPFLDAGYTMWVVTRKRGMPPAHGIADMAEDYAQLITDEFGGRVDLVIGEEPYGGMIGFCLAADHPEVFSDLAVLLAAATMSEQSRDLELAFAKLMSEHRHGEAGALLVRFMFPDRRLPSIDRLLGSALVRFAFGQLHPDFAHDVLVEAEAVAAFDGRPVLPRITVPVLLIGCDRDAAFTVEDYREAAELIPDCTLRIYEDATAFEAINDSRIPHDVLAFVRQRSADTSRPSARSNRRASAWHHPSGS